MCEGGWCTVFRTPFSPFRQLIVQITGYYVHVSERRVGGAALLRGQRCRQISGHVKDLEYVATIIHWSQKEMVYIWRLRRALTFLPSQPWTQNPSASASWVARLQANLSPARPPSLFVWFWWAERIDFAWMLELESFSEQIPTGRYSPGTRRFPKGKGDEGRRVE